VDAIVSALPDVRTATPVSSVRRQPGGGGGRGLHSSTFRLNLSRFRQYTLNHPW